VKLKDLYLGIVQEGIKHDPRTNKEIDNYLLSVKKEYDSLKGAEKKMFDKERLANPFSDTRIIFGNPDKSIRRIMAGIDIEVGELLLADRLNRKGKKIDLVFSHHPEGRARAEFYKVMAVQFDILKGLGLPAKKIKNLLDERMQEVERKVHAANCTRTQDAARLLGIPLMCAHTPADNFAYEYTKAYLEKRRPKTIADIFDILSEIPEYKIAAANKQGPKLIHGRLSSPCGKVLIEMTGGTEGSKKIYPELVKAKVKTIIGMHMSEEHFKKAKKYKLNILMAGHISSDTLGINLLLDEIEKKEKLDIIECSGFNRIRRT